MSDKPKILIIVDWFTPAFRAGGPIRSIEHLINHLYKEVDFHVLTSAYDLNTVDAVIGKEHQDRWISFENLCKVYYASSSRHLILNFPKIIDTKQYQSIYINSFFSFGYSIYPLLRLRGRSKLITLAPRGMLGGQALEIKSFKKTLYLKTAKLLGLYNNVQFHAASDKEAQDIQLFFKKNKRYAIQNLSGVKPNFNPRTKQANGLLNILFVARICEIKNIHKTLDYISKLPKSVQELIHFKIVGPIEDQQYYTLCKKLADQCQAKVEFIGECPAKELEKYYRWAHLFVSLSLHENFGHSIVEAFNYGLPCLLGKHTTPWNDLSEKNVGLNIDSFSEFQEGITHFLKMDSQTFNDVSKKCANYYQIDEKVIKAYKKMFLNDS